VELTALLGNETSELCGHEELVRLLYPAFRFKRRYGVPIQTAELNDIPGVAWGLIKVLAGSGIKYFSPGIQDYFAWWFKVHPMWDEAAVLPRDVPGAFWWQAQDGQRVLAWSPGGTIEGLYLWDYAQTERDLPAYLNRISAGGYAHDLIRVRLHGGRRDNAPPDLRFSSFTRDWNARWAYPQLRLTTNAAFFARFEAAAGDSLPSLRGDLPNTDYAVAATSRAKELGLNRLTHATLASAERLALWAGVAAKTPYPADALAEAYDCTLLSDEHTGGMDIPFGPAQEACWDQKGEFAYRAAALAQDVLVKSANAIADRVGLAQPGYHILVFNPLAFARTDVVRALAAPPPPSGRPMYWRPPAPGSNGTAEMTFGSALGRNIISLPAELLEGPFALLDVESGQSLPYQVVRLEGPLAARPLAAGRWAMGQVDLPWTSPLRQDRAQLLEIVFIAEQVPACGYKLFRIVPGGQSPAFPTDLQVGNTWLENRYYRVELDPRSGAITSLYDKGLGKEWVDRTAAHGFNQLVVRSPTTGQVSLPAESRIHIAERGPLTASLVVEGQGLGCPQRTQEISLYAGVKRLDLANRLLKDATPMLELYFAFPFDLDAPRFCFEASNGVIAPIEDQLPGSNTNAYTLQNWAAAWDQAAGVSWCSLEAPVVEFGGLWPGYVSQAHHGATPPGYGQPFLSRADQFEKGHIYSYVMDNNFRTNFEPFQVADLLFRYSLTTHPGDWRRGGSARFGWGVAAPLEPVFIHGPQAGDLPPAASFCALDQPNIQLLTLKAAEDGDGTVLRLAEMEGRETAVTVSLPFLDIERAHTTNLVEEDGPELPAERHSVRVTVPAYGLATVRCCGANRWPTIDWMARF
ncbi:MAG: glycosyl hydrolase-related protein, partial [Anaerolineales bacterium]